MFVMEIIDNFLSEYEFNVIKTNLMGRNFPWFLTQVIEYDEESKTHFGSGGLNEESLCDLEDNYQFSSLLYAFDDGSGNPIKASRFQVCLPLIKALKMSRVIHIKANLTVKTPKIIEHGYHTDHPYYPAKTAVYYVNSNDGYTKFETGEIVKSVANRVVIFDSNIKHTGTTCTDIFSRVVINMNWKD